MTVATIILEQLGGNRFAVMTGARSFYDLGNGLRFRLPSNFAKLGINQFDIFLNSMDTYDITVSKVRGGSRKVIDEFKGCYAEDMKQYFTRITGLDTHL